MRLWVDAQPKVEVLEDAGHGPGTDLNVERGEFLCDFLGGTVGPADTGDGVASDIVLELRFDGGDHLGRFFFQGRPPATGAAHAFALDLLGEQLLASSGHGTGVDTEQPGDAGIAAPTALQRFQAGIQAALAFVEQAGEQHDSGAQFCGHEVGIRYRSDQPEGSQQGAPSAQLLRLADPIGGAIQELTGNLLAGQLAFLDQLAQGILGADVQQVVQLPR